MMDVIESSTLEQKMLYSERTFTPCTFWLTFTRKQMRICETSLFVTTESLRLRPFLVVPNVGQMKWC